MKKLVFLLTFLLVFSANPLINAQAQSTFGDLYYKINYGSSVTITGCNENATSIEIPELIEGIPVTSIIDYAFHHTPNLKSISIPQSVRRISDYAFANNNVLENIIISEGVFYIGKHAFEGCTSLKNVILPDSVTEIGGNTFNGCKNLESVVLGKKITTLPALMFKHCHKLKNVKLPENLESIGMGCFSNCLSLETISLPQNLSSIGMLAFTSCEKLSYIYLPESVTSIGYYAFKKCTALKDVAIPERVTYMGENVFEDCNALETVVIPEIFKHQVSSDIPYLYLTAPIKVKIDGEEIAFDQKPVFHKERVIVPLRAIFENFGAEVSWDEATQTVTAITDGTEISLQINSDKMSINGEEKPLDVPARLVGGRTLVPVRAVSEAFGCSVEWIDNEKIVSIVR